MHQIRLTWRNPGWERVDTSLAHPGVTVLVLHPSGKFRREPKRLKRSGQTIVYPQRVPIISTPGSAKGGVPDISPLSRLAGHGMGEDRDVTQRFATLPTA